MIKYVIFIIIVDWQQQLSPLSLFSVEKGDYYDDKIKIEVNWSVN